MKKRILGAALLVAIAVAAGWNYQQNKQSVFSNLALENIEALAACEQTVGGSCWWNDASFSKCCEGGYYGCAPCE